MFHTLAFRGTVALVANTALAGIQDDIISLNPSTNRFMLPEAMNLYLATAFSATINRARINTPSYRLLTLPNIRPVQTGLRPTDLNIMQSFLDQPLRIPENEDLSVEATSDVGAGGEPVTAILFLGPQLEPIPPGDIYTMRATATGTATANLWTTMSITMDDTLPPGRYAMLASEHISATGYAHRWIVPNQFYRPGNLSNITLGARANWWMTNRMMGAYGTFLNTVIPQLQVLCTAADASHTLFLQLVRVS